MLWKTPPGAGECVYCEKESTLGQEEQAAELTPGNPLCNLETPSARKMSSGHRDDAAQIKFWNDPDLVEKLLPFLDPYSTLCLAQSKIGCTLDILQDKENPSNWRRLIKRSLPDNFWIGDLQFPDPAFDEDYLNLLRASFEQKSGQMMPLIAILKMMKDANSAMQDLLKVICEEEIIFFGSEIYITCFLRGSHMISLLGFLLLEEVEVAFGSSLHEIISVEVWSMDDLLLSALVARLSRQNRKMTRIDVIYPGLMITSRNSAEALCTLIQNCETAFLHTVIVSANIDRAARLHSCIL